MEEFSINGRYGVHMNSEILAGIVGAVGGGAITLLVNLIVERRREKHADGIESRKEKKEILQTRPEMAIVDYKDYLMRAGYGIQQKCDVELFVARIENVMTTGTKRQDVVCAHYREEDFNPDEWCCVIYKFENKGKTDISLLDIICNYKKDTCIFLCDAAQSMAANHMLNYSYCYDKKIRIGETITIKFCFHKDRVLAGMLSATMAIGMEDDNNRHWIQPLFVPDEKIYDSEQTSYQEYREQVLADMAEECFKKPWLW